MIEKLFDNSSYYLNIYAFPMFVTAFLVVLLGFFVFFQDKNRTTESFLICTISAGIWQAGVGAIYLMNNAALIIPFYKVFTFFGVVNIAPLFIF
ncbi:MAG TPA: hypothetical protein PLY85_05375 [Anaerolineaceae bacterium]|nr:hypothetical protein [Anaerolineaceae bacterium]